MITSPGRYVLRADLICGGGGGITINSSDVTLALEGHRITADLGANVAIVVGPTSVGGVVQDVHILGPGLITNSALYNFTAGVGFHFALNSEVSGITVRGGDGIEANDSDSLTITGNTLGRNAVGIYLMHSSATISDNDVSGSGIGIFVIDQRGITVTSTVSHNVLNGNTNAGLFFGSGIGVTVRNNLMIENGQDGIFVAKSPPGGANDVHVTSNRSLANVLFDLFNETPDCSGAVVWSGNTFFSANQSCIH